MVAWRSSPLILAMAILTAVVVTFTVTTRLSPASREAAAQSQKDRSAMHEAGGLLPGQPLHAWRPPGRWLVIVCGTLRGGPMAWRSLQRYVLDHYRADLALIGPPDNRSETAPLRSLATFNWNIPDPPVEYPRASLRRGRGGGASLRRIPNLGGVACLSNMCCLPAQGDLDGDRRCLTPTALTGSIRIPILP